MSGWERPGTDDDGGRTPDRSGAGGNLPPPGGPAPWPPPPPSGPANRPGGDGPASPPAAGWDQLPPPPGGPGLERSLTVGDVIEAMFRLLRETFGPVAAVAALLLGPGLVLLVVASSQLGDVGTLFDPNQLPDADLASIAEPMFFVLLGLGALLSIVGSAASVPAIMQVGVDHWNEVKPSIGRAIGVGLRRMWGIITVWISLVVPIFVVMVLPGILAAITGETGLLVLYVIVVPLFVVAVLVAVMYGYLVPAAVVAEDIGAWAAFGRVRRLLRGNFWPTFGRGLLIGFLLGIINSVLGFVSGFFGFLPPEAIIVLAILANIVSYVVMTPLANYGGLALYGDLRIRAEGADVLALASRLTG